MFNSRARILSALAVSAAILIGLSAILAAKSQPFDVAQYDRAVTTLNAVTQANQALQHDVLIARHGAQTQYDSLVTSAAGLRAAADALQSDFARVVENAHTKDATARLRAAVDERLAAVERFKPQNAISKNSLRYLPLAWRQYDEGMQGKLAAADIVQRAAAAKMVRSTLDAYVAPEAMIRKEARDSFAAFHPSTTEERLLKRHVQRVLEAEEQLAPIVNTLAGSSVEDEADAAQHVFGRAVAAASRQGQRWQSALAVWGMFILALLVLAAFKLLLVYKELDQMVHLRTRALNEKTAKMRLMFDSLDQGFFLVDETGTVGPERSAALERWFAGASSASSIGDVFGCVDAALAEWVELSWEDVFGGLLPPKLALQQLPSAIAEHEGRSFSIDYRLTTSLDGSQQVLVVMSETTDAVRRTRSERSQRQTVAIMTAIANDRPAYIAAFEELEQLVESVSTSTDDTVIKRAIHTIKGNAAVIGLECLRHWAETAETTMDASGEAIDAASIKSLRHQWDTIATDTRLMTNGVSTSAAVVERNLLLNLARELERIPDAAAQASALRDLSVLPVRTCFERMQQQAEQVAGTLNKLAPTVEIDDDGVKIDPESFRPFWASLIHVIRNSIDHGIESAQERRSVGKAQAGHLVMRARRADNAVEITVGDDGRGIDWDAVRDRSQETNGLRHSTSDLSALLFRTGFSTASTVTEVSGRGVGLSAVLSSVHSLGGDVVVESHRGLGTAFRFVIPVDMDGKATGPPVEFARDSSRSSVSSQTESQ